MRIRKTITEHRRLEFRLAVFIAIIAALIISIRYQSGCCAALFIVLGVVDGVWVYARRNKSIDED